MASTTRKLKGDVLLAARLRLGKTQRELSARCAELGRPIDFSNISKYERGLVVPGPHALPVLARALGLEVEDLIVRDGDAA